jgi:hypothetical protein
MESRNLILRSVLATLLACGLALTGCTSNESKPDVSSQPADAPAAQPAPAPVAQKPICKEEPAQPASNKKSKKSKKSKKTEKATPAVDCIPASEAAGVQTQSAPAPAPVATAPKASGSYDLSKNEPITDSSKAETGKGTLVKGINDWEGEISGIPTANSSFNRLRIGMSEDEVFDLIGPPTDHGAYVTGKAWIPFYHGSDRVRSEAVYKGQGRLIFSNQAGWGSGQYLTWIIHNANEPGNR